MGFLSELDLVMTLTWSEISRRRAMEWSIRPMSMGLMTGSTNGDLLN
jgi:hypothetical protein